MAHATDREPPDPGPNYQDHRPATDSAVVVLVCTACAHVYSPDRAAFGSGNTGCPLCGGWTWIARLATECPPVAVTGVDVFTGPAVTPPRTPAGPASPSV